MTKLTQLDVFELDTAITKRLGLGPATFNEIRVSLELMADKVANRDSHGLPEGWRLIDRRLQALRKAGRIKFSRKTGWSLT